MDYKKKYERAIENLKKIKEANKDNNELVDFIEYEYPELKENMDEKIRKELIKVFEERVKLGFEWKNGIPNNAVLAWLEKQGEQKIADKVEPKFKVGDWVIDKQGIVHQIANVIENVTCHTYGYDIVGGGYFNDNTEGVRLWTIQDAKDGDVLCCESGWTCIFKALNNHTNTFSSYCFMDCDKWFCNTGSECHTLDKAFIKAYSGEIYPATKEQRELLFQKMHESGYVWDAEKKELEKIEPVQPELPNGEDYGIDSLYHAGRILEKTLGKVDGYQSDDGILEHKCAIEAVKRLYKQKNTWSEEDESHIGRILSYLESFKAYNIPHIEPIIKEIAWLKSLKERCIWKPTDKQMGALKEAMRLYKSAHFDSQHYKIESLYQDLKKLREE